MWTALHDATVANGTMHIVPRAYRTLIEHERDSGSDHHIRCNVEESKAIPIEIKAGGVLFFNYGVPHCTKANTTDKERAGLALHFLRWDYRRPDRPNDYKGPLLSGPEATGGVREFGVKVEGTWDQQVERLLETTQT
jgi:ectoine hydroxylase-related dioxygenase (phytanoyl-CoA dioxygenase family)